MRDTGTSTVGRLRLAKDEAVPSLDSVMSWRILASRSLKLIALLSSAGNPRPENLTSNG